MKSLLQKVKALVGKKEAPARPIPKNACYFCKRKGVKFRKYYNEQQRKIKVCPLCAKVGYS